MGLREFFTNKDPYVPSERKRYFISEDKYSRDRIKALRDIHHELEAENNIALSLVIYGSLTKGKVLTDETAPRADMDMHLFFDAEGIDEEERGQIMQKLRLQVLEKLNNRKGQLGYTDVKKNMVGVIDKRFQVKALDHESIESAVNECLRWKLIKKVSDKTTVAHFFALSIGDLIKRYRNKFLLELSRRDDGEKIWKKIEAVIEDVERRKHGIPDKIRKQFPHTLGDALKFYGVS